MDAVKSNTFYVIPHRGIMKTVEARMRDILDLRLPTNPMP
jgi:hypothetical protein